MQQLTRYSDLMTKYSIRTIIIPALSLVTILFMPIPLFMERTMLPIGYILLGCERFINTANDRR